MRCVKCTILLLTKRPRCSIEVESLVASLCQQHLVSWLHYLCDDLHCDSLPAYWFTMVVWHPPPTTTAIKALLWCTEIIAVSATSWWVCVCASVHHLNKTSLNSSEYLQKVKSGVTLCGMLAKMLFLFLHRFQFNDNISVFLMRQIYKYNISLREINIPSIKPTWTWTKTWLLFSVVIPYVPAAAAAPKTMSIVHDAALL